MVDLKGSHIPLACCRERRFCVSCTHRAVRLHHVGGPSLVALGIVLGTSRSQVQSCGGDGLAAGFLPWPGCGVRSIGLLLGLPLLVDEKVRGKCGEETLEL